MREGSELPVKLLSELDPVLNHPTRFGVMTVLFAIGPQTVGDLVRILNVSYGPLSTHIRKLKEAGYVESRKVVTLKGPRTLLTITSEGIKAYVRHVEKLRKLVSTISTEA